MLIVGSVTLLGLFFGLACATAFQSARVATSESRRYYIGAMLFDVVAVCAAIQVWVSSELGHGPFAMLANLLLAIVFGVIIIAPYAFYRLTPVAAGDGVEVSAIRLARHSVPSIRL